MVSTPDGRVFRSFPVTIMYDDIFSLQSWPRAVLHIDGDAFFTSCEEAIHPHLKGKPLITGGERGIVACASYAAKRRGVTRGVPLHEAKRCCPGLIVLPSDYETYSLFSTRMFAIIRRFTPQVEEYSIDEAFADLTGLRRSLHSSYPQIARMIKDAVEQELGIGVTIGLSITKVLAKIASKYQKPNGFTLIPGRDISHYLRDLPVASVWGIGHATTNHLAKLGITTALDFARLPESTVRRRFVKPIREIWSELRGITVYAVSPEGKTVYTSISKVKTFAPPRYDAAYLFAQLLRNCESACIKARRYSLAPRKIIVLLKRNNFNIDSIETRLSRPSAYPLELTACLRDCFGALYRPHVPYRATGIILTDLHDDSQIQYSLFEDTLKADYTERLYDAADRLAAKFGKHTLHLGSSHLVESQGKGKRGTPTVREETTLTGESKRRHLGLPLFHIDV